MWCWYAGVLLAFTCLTPALLPSLSCAGAHVCLRHRRLLLPPEPQDGGQGALCSCTAFKQLYSSMRHEPPLRPAVCFVTSPAVASCKHAILLVVASSEQPARAGPRRVAGHWHRPASGCLQPMPANASASTSLLHCTLTQCLPACPPCRRFTTRRRSAASCRWPRSTRSPSPSAPPAPRCPPRCGLLGGQLVGGLGGPAAWEGWRVGAGPPTPSHANQALLLAARFAGCGGGHARSLPLALHALTGCSALPRRPCFARRR